MIYSLIDPLSYLVLACHSNVSFYIEANVPVKLNTKKPAAIPFINEIVLIQTSLTDIHGYNCIYNVFGLVEYSFHKL